MSDKYLLYDGSFYGLLSVVYHCVYTNTVPVGIAVLGEEPVTMFETQFVDTDEDKAARVEASFYKKIDPLASNFVQMGFLTKQPDMEMRIYRFLIKAYELGPRIMENHGVPEFVELSKAIVHLSNELQRLRGFIRFTQLPTMLFAKIDPKNNVLPGLADHFVNRFSTERFVIYDNTYKQALVYKGGKYTIMQASLEDFKEQDTNGLATATQASEDKYRRLWLAFHKTIAIESRRNPTCQRTMLPKWYRKNMLEMVDTIK